MNQVENFWNDVFQGKIETKEETNDEKVVEIVPNNIMKNDFIEKQMARSDFEGLSHQYLRD